MAKEKLRYLAHDGRTLRTQIEGCGSADSKLPAELPPTIIKWEKDVTTTLARRPDDRLQFQNPGLSDRWNPFAATVGAAYARINLQLEVLEHGIRSWE